MSGEMPEEWSRHRLGDLVEIANDGISAGAIAELNAVAHYSLPAFDEGQSPEITAGLNIKSNKSLVPLNCVLFSKLNPRIPRVWRVAERSQLPSVCSTEFWPLVARSDDVDLDFLTAFVGSEAFLGAPQIAPSSSTNSHQRVDRSSFENYILALPPVDEQRRIAEVLRSVDKVIGLNRRTVDQAENALKAARGQLTGLDGRETGWAIKPILDCFQLQRGHDLPVQSRNDGDVPVIASNGPVGFHDHAPVPAPAVITGRSGTIGKVTYFDGPCWPLNTTLFVRDFKDSDPRFVYHFLSAFPLSQHATGTGVPTLNRNDVHVVEVGWPKREEQHCRAQVLDSLEANWLAEKISAEACQTMKNKLASDLLSGSVRVFA